ncbi:hypothetical protein MycrhN_0208 [Mycolicibacterium rhodesiae NBB3]|uniref:Uncharacterized protein n=2 Tax=Mycolicibacterium rhodesiae TaxID=36814 RepID=G8RHP9_MYCRN|nr:hypothetical protein MycrhN_0208 [Mycolicibacterium rhodesiae NBB3]
MTTTIERTVTAPSRQPPIAGLRMQLKPGHQACGFVQGAWWPRSTLLTDELPPLLTAISLRLGTIERVQYHEEDWSPAPLHTDDIVLDASHDSPHVISLYGPQFGKLTLLVVPPYTDATHAYDVVTTAASALDSSTPDELLDNAGQSVADRPPKDVDVCLPSDR